MKLCNNENNINLMKIYNKPRELQPSIVSQCYINQSLISDGCKLTQCQIDKCVIGIRSIINEGCYLNNVLVLGADYYKDNIGIGKNCIISNAIIDKNVKIGNNCIIKNVNNVQEYYNPENDWAIKDGIIIICKGANIPSNTTI